MMNELSDTSENKILPLVFYSNGEDKRNRCAIEPNRNAIGFYQWRLANLQDEEYRIVCEYLEAERHIKCSVCGVLKGEFKILTCGGCGNVRAQRIFYCVCPTLCLYCDLISNIVESGVSEDGLATA
jgi:hypothetical protein